MTEPEDPAALRQLNEVCLGFALSQTRTMRRRRLRRLRLSALIVFASGAAGWLCHFFFGALP